MLYVVSLFVYVYLYQRILRHWRSRYLLQPCPCRALGMTSNIKSFFFQIHNDFCLLSDDKWHRFDIGPPIPSILILQPLRYRKDINRKRDVGVKIRDLDNGLDAGGRTTVGADFQMGNIVCNGVDITKQYLMCSPCNPLRSLRRRKRFHLRALLFADTANAYVFIIQKHLYNIYI